MALWGNKDSKTASGTVSITTGGAVTGSSTAFTTEAKIGNIIKVGTNEYVITTITDDTHATVISGITGATPVAKTGQSYALSEKPSFVAQESLGDTSKVFGVDAAEVSEGSNDVVEITIANAGTGYKEVPNVTFASGAQTATATISGGSLATVTITGSGAYSSAPDVYIDVPRRTIPTSGVDTSGNEFTYAAHGIDNGQRLRYNDGGSTSITGLTSGTTYYAVKTAANKFKLAASLADATADIAVIVDISGTGNNAQFFDLLDETTATVTAVLGSGAGGTQVTHAGWVRRTVGTGGRAGRVFYETLVAGGSITGDAADDIQFPDN
jgi:hypothetical protein